MQKALLPLFLILSLCVPSHSSNVYVKECVRRIDEALAKRPQIEVAKQHKIDSLIHCSYLATEPFSIYQLIYEEYRSYNYDTALSYTQIMTDLASQLNDRNLIMESRIDRAFVYMSGGLFHESHAVLSRLHPANTPIRDSLPDELLLTYARLLYDMAGYADGASIADNYISRANSYMLALSGRYTPSDSAKYWYPLAAVDMMNKNYSRSIIRMKEAMKDSRVSQHDLAIYASSLAYLYRMKGDNENALKYYTDAVVYDIESCTYETIALRMVAEMLYEQDEIELANKFMRIALQDAQRYHARHRQVSISQLLPIIETHHSERMQRRTLTAYVFLSIACFLLIIGLIGIMLLLRRNHTIRNTRNTIDKINQDLSIANHLKEEMLGTMLVSQSQYLNAVEKYQDKVKNDVVHRQLSELMTIPKNADAKLQRQLFYHRVDEMILRVFPSFVDEFNALLQPGCAMEIKQGELLNPQLRIFALIRLGVTHNEVIAEILDYSVNTVYTYKTRTINQSLLKTEQFYEALMHIL